MKKLTAGIFASILGLAAIGAADAAVTSKQYVDNAIDAAKTAVTQSIAGDYATKDALTAETNARTQADSTLQGNIDDVAADVLLKQDQLKDTMIVKQGTGNVVSGITASDGVITYTTAAVATSEGLAKLQEDVSAAEGDIANIKAEQTTQNEAIQGLQNAGYITNAALTGYATENWVETKDYATKTEAQGYADAKDTAISAAQTTANEAKDAASAADGKAVAAGEAAEAAQTTADNAAAAAAAAAKISTQKGNDGVYVLTATVAGDSTTYKWEVITRTGSETDETTTTSEPAGDETTGA